MARVTESVSEPKRIMSMADNKPDLDRELTEIKREVIEGRNLVIKTDNLLKNLHAELKAVSKRQEEFEKRKLISSGVAYVVFAALAVTGAILVSQARVSAAGVDKDRYEKTIAELTLKLDETRKDATERQAAATRAFDVYRLMTERPGDERLQGVEQFAKMEMSRVSALEKQALKDRAEALRNEIGQSALERGKQAFRRNDMAGTVKELSRFMAMNPNPSDRGDAAFFLGVAHNQLRQYEKAAEHLGYFVQENKRSKNRDYAMLLLAHSYEQTGALDKAAEITRDALGTYPNSEFGGQLRGRLSSIKRAQAGTNVAAAAAPAAAPAAVPAAGAAAPQAAPAAGAAPQP